DVFDRGLDEANQFRDILVENGIPDSAILVESISQNTHQNAVETKKVLDQHPEIESILLVTSALHMKRAKACFEAAGFKGFDCFTTDHFTGKHRGYSFDQYLVPDMSVMEDWSNLIHEWIGYMMYATMRYI
ncbi:YdcF family protein, partial [Crocinitomix catalasitica]|nr:YdcF family protein [Crocinitomix catalasitica]